MMASTDNSTRSADGPASDSSDALPRSPSSFSTKSASTKPTSTITSRTTSGGSLEATASTTLSPTPRSTQATKPMVEESSVGPMNSSLSTPTAARPTAAVSSDITQVESSQITVSTASPGSVIAPGDFGNPVRTWITTVIAPPEDTETVADFTVVSSTTTVPSKTLTDGPPSAYTDSLHAAGAEHPPLSNGATAGIVLAVVAVLLGTFFLARYIYKKRGLCSRPRSFFPTQEPCNRFSPGPISRPIPQDNRRHSWLSHPGGRPGGRDYPSVVISPGRDESMELQTFTRPVHGPRMYDIGHSGNAPIVHRYNSSPPQDSQGPPMSPPRSPTAPPANQTVQEEPVSPESPHPSVSVPEAEGRALPSRDRTGAIPWEDGYRYRAW